MCSSPNNIEGQDVACRKCNDCINARKNGWVARAMAEKSTSAETFSVTLTYDDSTQENRDAAKTFEYRHVKNWLKRMRSAIEYNTGKTGALRYLVAGERGSENGRCHWHVILFANADVLSLGEMKAWPSGKVVTERADKITEGKRRKRLNWSLWPHGFITFQEPNQWGMEYALAYALKDQFNVVAAQGTMREGHVSRTSAGMFRMSKMPPIGFQFLENYCDRMDETGQLPVSTRLKVPDYNGYWFPTGMLREYFLDRIRLANQLYVGKNGRNAPQWSTLLNSVLEMENDWERLVNGTEETEEQQAEEYDDWKLSVLLRTKEIRAAQETRDTRARCGGIAPCARCVKSLTPEGYEIAKEWARKQAQENGGFDAADKKWRTTNRCNPFCNFRDLPPQKRAFKKGA